MFQKPFDITLPISDPVLIFALVMVIILLAPLLFSKLRIPGIVGLLLAGTLVGPGVLGLLERDDTMVLLGTVGLLYLMFMAGLSIDINKFLKLKDRSLVFGSLSFFIPQLAAIAVCMLLLDFDLPSALLAGSIVGSHTLLAYPIASRLGIARNTSVTMTMGGTIVTDTLSLFILAIVAATVHDETDFWYWSGFVVMVGLYTALVLFGLPALGKWFFRSLRNQTNTEYVFLIAVLFVTAWLAEVAGLAPIIGAFLAGLAMNRLVPDNSTLMSRVQFVGNALFIPFFLISVGMLVDLTQLLGLEVWLTALAFSGLVLAGKGAASQLTRWIYSYTGDEAWTVYGLSIPQAAATLAVTLIGFDLGLFGEMVVNAVVIMILLTCLLGPFLVETFGRRVALQEKKEPYKPSEAPERILVPLANPATAEAMMDLALMIRQESSTEPVFPLTVARDSLNVEAEVASSEKMLSHAVVHAAAADVPVMPVTRVDMNIASGIYRAVKELRISHIVIGWSGISARERIFGSVLDQLLEQTDEMMLVCKLDHPMNTTATVWLAVPPLAEYEPGFHTALDSIKTLTRQLGSRLHVLVTGQNHETVKDGIEHHEPRMEAEYQVLTYWGQLMQQQTPEFEHNDMMVLLAARTGSISWHTSLDRLPTRITGEHPHINYISVYPPEYQEQELPATRIQFKPSAHLPALDAGHISINLQDLSYPKCLEKMLEPLFVDQPEKRNQTASRLLDVDPDNTSGDLPGVILTHTTSDAVTTPTLLMGISKQGISHESMDEPVHVIFILLTPPSHSLQRRLNMLSRLARTLREPDTVAQLRQAETVDQISTIFPVAEEPASTGPDS